MDTTIFRVGEINRLRRRAQHAASSDVSAPEGWSISTVDSMAVLAAFNTLRIRPGLILRAYQFCDGGNGNGMVWAMPSDAPFPEPDACPRIEGASLRPPKPADALEDAMQAIEGDGSPLSYLSASVLARELFEFGARWHGVRWGQTQIIGRTPRNRPARVRMMDAESGPTASRCTWLAPVPKQWLPQTTHTGNDVEVCFHMFDNIGIESLTQVTDSFSAESYAFNTTSREIAAGETGIIFEPWRSLSGVNRRCWTGSPLRLVEEGAPTSSPTSRRTCPPTPTMPARPEYPAEASCRRCAWLTAVNCTIPDAVRSATSQYTCWCDALQKSPIPSSNSWTIPHPVAAP